MRTTVRREQGWTGRGLHSGLPCAVVVAPAKSGQGRRINGRPATIEHVVDGAWCTTIETDDGPVRTVEHLLAALAGLGIDDCDVRVKGGEVPILDGSVGPFRERLEPLEQRGQRDPLVLTAPVEVRDGDRWVRALPAEVPSLAVDVAYRGLGRQRFDATLGAFAAASTARTFGFLRDRARLEKVGLAKGAALANTLVFDDAGEPVNPGGLRFDDEPARHKWLDLLGDLALLGRPLQARVVAYRGGHALHHALVRALRAVPGSGAVS
jgi:UDP-3-O-[3-hydroxymyristoyl] N-acetylglucosamine deacetylase